MLGTKRSPVIPSVNARPLWDAGFKVLGLWFLVAVRVCGWLVWFTVPCAGPGVVAGPRQCPEASSVMPLGAVAVPGQYCDLRCHFASPEPIYSVGFLLMCLFKSYLRDHLSLNCGCRN